MKQNNEIIHNNSHLSCNNTIDMDDIDRQLFELQMAQEHVKQHNKHQGC